MFAVLLILALSYVHCSFTSDYPESIPVFKVRVDSYSNKTVTSGLLHGFKHKVSLQEFKRRLQCSANEPDFDYNSGSVSLLRTIPPTKEIVELIAAYGENRCSPWTACHADRAEYLRNNKSVPQRPQSRGYYGFQDFKMFRVMKGKLYFDWPWGVDRFRNNHDVEKHVEMNQIVPLMQLVLDKINDMPDSVFLAGSEHPAFHWDIPFPIFSFASSFEFTDMPWPWLECLKTARSVYRSMVKQNGSFVYDPEATVKESRALWQQKKPKAAFFAGYDSSRVILFDEVRKHPDLFEGAFGFPVGGIRSWNPLSKENVLTDAQKQTITPEQIQKAAVSTVSGYALPLMSLNPDRRYDPKEFKYVIVPMGLDGRSTSGRLANLLATSGAVILLQRTHLVYHFSARLKPWVHYVPLSYSGADVAEKVRWLRDHDDLARQIAENGRSFARSYLRLEDYYCYGAAALEMVGELERGSDALIPFDPRPLDPIYSQHRIQHTHSDHG